MSAQKIFNVEGRVAFVTGAGSGLGRAMAEAMAEGGAKVACFDLDPLGLAETAATLERSGAEVRLFTGDVGDEAAVDAAVADRGKIINTASMWGLAGSSSVFPLPAYNATKGALVNLTRELALQYAEKNIQVNAICPGFFRTKLGPYDDKEFVAAITNFTPMKRIAEAEEIKGTALYLASSASDFVTGTTLVIDGGCLAK
jgi:NAD(P)-dependent dehydrogenase (short-subunit alcohol dehydrogenase family)